MIQKDFFVSLRAGGPLNPISPKLLHREYQAPSPRWDWLRFFYNSHPKPKEHFQRQQTGGALIVKMQMAKPRAREAQLAGEAEIFIFPPGVGKTRAFTVP